MKEIKRTVWSHHKGAASQIKEGMEIYMKKRIVSILLALSLAVIAGCGEAPQASQSPVSQTEVSEETSISEETGTSEAVTETSVEEVVEEEKAPEDVYLKDIYAEHGLKVGTCLTTEMTGREASAKLITSQFTSVTMENAMKPDYIFSKKKSTESGELTIAFNSDMKEMLDWAKENNMSLRGHTLIWHSQTPKWIFCEGFDAKNDLVSRDEMLKRMESMISQMFAKLEEEGYIDLFYAYDVVNEAWLDNGSMRKDESYWYKTIGEDYLWYAFYYANKYAPESIDLYYNDYNEQYKVATITNFVKTLVDEDGNYLIDGIGLQAHLYTSDDITSYLSALKHLGETGLKLEITELDVSLGSYQKTEIANEDTLRKQGRYYYNLINGIFEMIDDGTIQMDSITYWGYSDSMSWRRAASPLLYNSLGRPKYAFYGAAQLKEFSGFNE